jgi:catechol 2,3-dioxygenase-like lactoylglutathione lyase family enzyme
MRNYVPASQKTTSGTLAGSRLSHVLLYVNDLPVSRRFYEDGLGLRLIESDACSAKYDTGQTRLHLQRASDHGVTLATRDHSADLTFLVDDLDSVRRDLENGDITFSDTLRYEIGATVNFSDPDGHWFSLYEPSPLAMTWPSSEKIRTLMKTGRKGRRLEGRELIYLFIFVPDPDQAFTFYHEVLGLHYLESRPCRRGSADNPRAVVKYDAGGLMLTTHHFDGQCPATASRELTTGQMKGMVPVFRTSDIDLITGALTHNGVHAREILDSIDGRMVRFEDPFGRAFLLHQPG